MPSTSRRDLLLAAPGFLGFLAGCNGGVGPSPTPTEPGPPDDALLDPPMVNLRNPAVAPIVTRADEETPTRSETERSMWRREVIGDMETADALTFADVEGADRARQFLDETDFGSETVFVEQSEVAECYELELCWIRWADGSIETAYARGYRDADVDCESGADDVVANLVRLPVALDPEQIRGGGSSTTSGHCGGPEGIEGEASGEAQA